MKVNDLEEAWTLLEEAMKENKAENASVRNGHTKEPQENGNSEQTNGKRKLLEESEDDMQTNGNGTVEPLKKKKKKVEENGTEQSVEEPATEETTAEKFSFSETIRNILSTKKKNEATLKKLKAKVVRKYQKCGSEWSDKVEKKFNKKIQKIPGIVVDNDRIRLIQ